MTPEGGLEPIGASQPYKVLSEDELDTLSKRQLRQHGMSIGVDAAALEEAQAGSTPKADLIKLILAKSRADSEGPAPQPEPQPEQEDSAEAAGWVAVTSATAGQEGMVVGAEAVQHACEVAGIKFNPARRKKAGCRGVVSEATPSLPGSPGRKMLAKVKFETPVLGPEGEVLRVDSAVLSFPVGALRTQPDAAPPQSGMDLSALGRFDSASSASEAFATASDDTLTPGTPGTPADPPPAAAEGGAAEPQYTPAT